MRNTLIVRLALIAICTLPLSSLADTLCKGLGACSSPNCPNPQLRVHAQTFLLTNDSRGQNFQDYDYAPGKGTYHQPKSLPRGGKLKQYLGSTTGPKYNESECSPLHVSWEVSTKCLDLDINSMHAWCKNNLFEENHGHGVRALVTQPPLLSGEASAPAKSR